MDSNFKALTRLIVICTIPATKMWTDSLTTEHAFQRRPYSRQILPWLVKPSQVNSASSQSTLQSRWPTNALVVATSSRTTAEATSEALDIVVLETDALAAVLLIATLPLLNKYHSYSLYNVLQRYSDITLTFLMKFNTRWHTIHFQNTKIVQIAAQFSVPPINFTSMTVGKVAQTHVIETILQKL